MPLLLFHCFLILLLNPFFHDEHYLFDLITSRTGMAVSFIKHAYLELSGAGYMGK